MRQIRVTNKLWNPLWGLVNETNEVSSGSLRRLSGTSFTNYDYDLVLRDLHGLFQFPIMFAFAGHWVEYHSQFRKTRPSVRTQGAFCGFPAFFCIVENAAVR